MNDICIHNMCAIFSSFPHQFNRKGGEKKKNNEKFPPPKTPLKSLGLFLARDKGLK